MECAVVRAALQAGIQPIVAMKLDLMQPNTYGLRNFCFSIVNLHERSFLALVGFWKQNSEDANDVTMLGVTNGGRPITARPSAIAALTDIFQEERALQIQFQRVVKVGMWSVQDLLFSS